MSWWTTPLDPPEGAGPDSLVMNIKRKLFRDFLQFSEIQLASWDIDPTYPVLKQVYKKRRYDQEQALWHTAIYVTYYHLGSTEIFFAHNPHPTTDTLFPFPTALPTGTERRGFRGQSGRVKTHLDHISRRRPISTWLRGMTWDEIRDSYKSIRFGGDWSSYKFADLLKWVHDFPITASDFGVGGGGEKAGPIAGMSILTGYPRKECATNIGLQKEFYELCLKRMPHNTFYGMDQCETCLCDFNSMLVGRYYPGHDIDQQLEFIRKAGPWTGDYLEARRVVFHRNVLGEVNGWLGVRKDLNKLYYETGKIYDPFINYKPKRDFRFG